MLCADFEVIISDLLKGEEISSRFVCDMAEPLPDKYAWSFWYVDLVPDGYGFFYQIAVIFCLNPELLSPEILRTLLACLPSRLLNSFSSNAVDRESESLTALFFSRSFGA